MKNRNLISIGEFGLIDIIKNQFIYSTKNDKDVIVGMGDDSFCFKLGGKNICITKDMLIEDVHFKKEWTSPQEIGVKAIEVSVSDIAAMGGDIKPKYVFIGLGVPPITSEIFVRGFFNGLKRGCNKYGIVVAGGDTVKSDKIIISITVVGIGQNKIIKRSGAKNGDFIGVTNTFGNAGAGIYLLYKYGPKHKYSKDERFLISKQNNPKARLKESWQVSKHATSLTDASDGLYISIDLLTKDSAKGASIYLDKIPVSSNLKKVFKEDKKQLHFALFGAEDYELVFTVPEAKTKLIKKIVPQVSYIGKINSSKIVKYFYNGKEQKIKYSGYKHF
ncbi:MAG: thiamine-phosphate kinase [Endomicrobium sp.]|jgi:thiamine-monophosphate kinase|nr:thiamine-phosphate kinase [Endomicrobium sp.]